MENKKLRIYLASSWFTVATRDILDRLESLLSARSYIELYSPRRDGVMLTPNQRHDTDTREKVFKENIEHILSSDLVVANIYSGDSYNDPGTMYEIGYAMANNVPVVGFSTKSDNISERFKGIINGIPFVIGYENLISYLDNYVKEKEAIKGSKVLFVGNGDTEVDEKIVTHIMDSGASLRWVNNLHNEVYTKIDEIFKDVDYMIAVIDDRKTITSWMIGQAYARKIPVVTYSNYNYMINVMLLVSVLTHIRGTDELVEFLQKVNRYGLESIPKFDISQIESC